MRKKFITAQDLSDLPLILPRRMQVRSELASWFGDYYKDLNVVFTGNLSTNSAVMVSRVLAWKRGQPFSLAASKFIEHAKCFLGMATA